MNPRDDPTNDPNLGSWVESANDPTTDFPIQNLPFGVFAMPGVDYPRLGVAIGDQLLDLTRCRHRHLLKDLSTAVQQACVAHTLNPMMALDRRQRWSLRRRISALLEAGGPKEQVEPCLLVRTEVEMLLPAQVGDFTDFYASLHHATHVGELFRPDNPLLPNYKHLPIGYHGRASSIVISGTKVRRPIGQTKEASSDAPSFGPSQRLDYELEVGFFVGPGNELGEAVRLSEAEDHIFGLCLVNDWSARDIQAWEYQPLGPFLGKSFATSVSPWVVTLEALAPFRVPVPPRPSGDPEPLRYLSQDLDRERGGIDLKVQAWLRSKRMRDERIDPVLLGEASFSDMYWTVGQMLVHHASNGCNLRPGDLLASGTVSGEGQGSLGCLLEITRMGKEPLVLPTDEQRVFLEDGDEVVLRGFCEGEGYRRIGFGDCVGRVAAAAPPAR